MGPPAFILETTLQNNCWDNISYLLFLILCILKKINYEKFFSSIGYILGTIITTIMRKIRWLGGGRIFVSRLITHCSPGSLGSWFRWSWCWGWVSWTLGWWCCPGPGSASLILRWWWRLLHLGSKQWEYILGFVILLTRHVYIYWRNIWRQNKWHQAQLTQILKMSLMIQYQIQHLYHDIKVGKTQNYSNINHQACAALRSACLGRGHSLILYLNWTNSVENKIAVVVYEEKFLNWTGGHRAELY